jgi:hypothetical protein
MAIDATKPADGRAASKADLRANLQAIKDVPAVAFAETASALSGKANQYLKVNSAETAIESVAQAAGGDASATTYTQAGTGGVQTTVQAKLREISVSVKDFGAAGDGTTDDSDAIEAAIDAVSVSASGGDASKSVFFPRGRYRVTRSVFSHTPGGATGRGAIVYRGEHGAASVILLDPPSATETWLYNNGTSRLYYFCEWHNLGFRSMGPNAAYASGFRTYSTGYEQGFKWICCYMGQQGGMRRGWLTTGPYNASEYVVAYCHIRDITEAVFTWDNSQSLNIDFIATNVETDGSSGTLGDIFVVTSNGGGYLRVWGGSYIWGDGNSSMKYLLKIAGGNNQHTYTFNGLKCEHHDRYAGLVYKDGANGNPTVIFRDCDFNGLENAYGAFEGVTISQRCNITFDNCVPLKEMTYRLTNTGQGQEHSGAIVFQNCRVPEDFRDKFTLSGYGYAAARGCYARWPGPTQQKAVDWDLGWENMFKAGRDVAVKRAVLKSKVYGWPETTTTNEAPSPTSHDRIVILPTGSRIIGIKVYRPAAGAGTGQYQLHVGSNDRSTIYASSEAGRTEQQSHEINVDFPPSGYINVGSDTNLKTVTLWADPGGNPWAGALGNLAGEVALIEYI